MRTVFMGTPEFAVPCLRTLNELTDIVAVYTQPDKPKGRGLATSPPPVKSAAAELGLPVRQPERLRRKEVLSELLGLRPELIVVVAYAQILPKQLLSLPARGCINVHASLLPAYRGGAPIHWAVLNGEQETGVTTMLMSSQLDAGDILLQARTPIGGDETTGQVHDRLAVLGAELLGETLQRLQQGTLKPQPQPEQGISYARNIRKDDGLIDWRRPAVDIHNQIRGLNPWPAAFTGHDQRLLRIWSSRLSDDDGGKPGQVLRLTEEGPIVAAGSGSILLLEVQPANRRKMSGAAYARGYALQPGSVLGAN